MADSFRDADEMYLVEKRELMNQPELSKMKQTLLATISQFYGAIEASKILLEKYE